ncbi:MAG: hypothetical protein ACRDBG_03025, partial [Waterburya sp.]
MAKSRKKTVVRGQLEFFGNEGGVPEWIIQDTSPRFLDCVRSLNTYSPIAIDLETYSENPNS